MELVMIKDTKIVLKIIIIPLKTYQMSIPRKSYTKAEKLEIVKLSLEESETIKNLAERFEISGNTIYNWRSLNHRYAVDSQGVHHPISKTIDFAGILMKPIHLCSASNF